jgi:hypothetical protein
VSRGRLEDGRSQPPLRRLRILLAAAVTEKTPGRRRGCFRQSRRESAADKALVGSAWRPFIETAASRRRLSRHLDDSRSLPLLGRLPRAAEAAAVPSVRFDILLSSFGCDTFIDSSALYSIRNFHRREQMLGSTSHTACNIQ